MLDVPLYSQRDPKWANEIVGFGPDPFKKVGCTVTATAALVSYVYQQPITPNILNKKMKEVNGFSNGQLNGLGKGQLLVWSKVPLVYPKLKYIKRAWNYNNIEVAYYVYAKRLPVVVQVRAIQIGALVHWVTYIGSQKMLDPWFGTVLPTSRYNATGYALFSA